MRYIYNDKKPYRYYDIIIAEYHDTLEIEDDRIINKQRGVDISNGTGGIIQDIKSKCELCSDQSLEPTEESELDAIDDEISGMRMLRVSNNHYYQLSKLGLLDSEVRNHNVGNSDYSQHVIQPWAIWLDYDLNPWDADIIKRILRTKEEPGMTEKESRALDYSKIIHICQERIRQLSL